MPQPTSPDYHAVTPHLVASNAAEAIDFYARAFGATERYRLVEPSGKIGHAELAIGDSIVMLADEYPDFGARSAVAFGGSPVKLLLYVADCDAVARRAIDAGATELRPVRDSSTATARARWSTRSASRGRSPRGRRSSLRRRCSGASRPRSAREPRSV